MPKGITSLGGYIRRIEELQKKKSGELFFRGHTDSRYEPVPSLFRDSIIEPYERNMLYDALTESPSEFQSDLSTFDKLVRAQHFGVKTRLLDLTTNPLIALYFACEGQTSARGRVLIFEIDQEEAKYFLSDAISCKANLAHLTIDERRDILREIVKQHNAISHTLGARKKLPAIREEHPTDYRDLIENLNEHRVVKRLVRFIRSEKPHFQAEIDPIDLLKVDVVYPKKSNHRILAQSGAFFVFGLNKKLQASMVKKVKVQTIDIGPGHKRSVLNSLSAVGVHEHSVYPELERLSRKIGDKYSFPGDL